MNPYRVYEVWGSKSWYVVGRADSDTTLFYYKTKGEAEAKLMSLKADGLKVELGK